MSRLIVFREGDAGNYELDTADGTLIAAALRAVGVRFERWEASLPISREMDDVAVMAAYGSDIERLKSAGGYRSVDVLRCLPDNPQRQALRRKFLQEHTHDEDEVRFFVEGAGVFYLRSAGKVHVTRCERSDLLSVPAGTRHWFDMGPAPFFTAIRLFTNPEGWVARFTGDRIAEQFPGFENVPA